MPRSVVFSIIESPTHPDFSAVYQRLGLDEVRLTSTRKAIGRLKEQAPDFVVAEFFYGYGNNYAGVNISNLDVFLFSLQKYAPRARVIVLVDKGERAHVDKLSGILPLHAVLTQPVAPDTLAATLAAALTAAP
jgi:DNA-binding NarL/FixJ family response regulator